MKIVEDKLDRFESELVADVEAQKKRILDEAEKDNFERFDRKETEVLSKAYFSIQAGLKKIDKQKNEIISKVIMENKTTLLNKRMEVIEAVFLNAVEELIAFTKGPEYRDYLIKMIRDNLSVIGDGEIVIYINHTDEGYLDELNQIFTQQIRLEEKSIDMIGGCKIFNSSRRAFLDDSFARRLEDEKVLFLQNCKIQIDES